jgi:hypothetical protein
MRNLLASYVTVSFLEINILLPVIFSGFLFPNAFVSQCSWVGFSPAGVQEVLSAGVNQFCIFTACVMIVVRYGALCFVLFQDTLMPVRTFTVDNGLMCVLLISGKC